MAKKNTKRVIIINGPNLNMLGKREPGIYGKTTLADIEKECIKLAKELYLSLEFKQHNEEGALVNIIQESTHNTGGLIINAGAYTHTSVAIRDALLSTNLPIIEVHISNIFKREEFRHNSYISDIASGLICGLGPEGYTLALRAMKTLLG